MRHVLHVVSVAIRVREMVVAHQQNYDRITVKVRFKKILL